MERRWGQRGGPWEFNVRDIFRWCQLMQADQSPGFFNPGQHVGLVYADRMRTEADKAQVTTATSGHIYVKVYVASVLHSVWNFVLRCVEFYIQVLATFRKVFGADFEPYTGSRQFHITPLNLQVCQHLPFNTSSMSELS